MEEEKENGTIIVAMVIISYMGTWTNEGCIPVQELIHAVTVRVENFEVV